MRYAENITRGTQSSQGVAALLYGDNGVGKTASLCTDGALIIDCEGSAAQYDVPRLEPASWPQCIDMLHAVAEDAADVRIVAVDGLDALQEACKLQIAADSGKSSWTMVGLIGYTLLGQYVRAQLIPAIDAVCAQGVHVVLTAHSELRQVQDPVAGGEYTRIQPRLQRQFLAPIADRVDVIGYARQPIVLIASESMTRSTTSGERVIETQPSGSWVAKSRLQLPAQVPLAPGGIGALLGIAQ